MLGNVKKSFLIFSILFLELFTIEFLSSLEIYTLEGDITEYYIETLHNEISSRGSGIYNYPEELDIKDFTEIIELIKNGNDQSILTASIRAQDLGYEIIKFHQKGPNDNIYFILKEKVPKESKKNKKGWGSYIINYNPENDIIIESPYPLNHINTGLISVIAFKELKAKALLLPGAHRFSSSEKRNGIPVSDVGFTERSIFNTVHQILTDSEKIVIQFQGYNKITNKENRKNYPPTILTNSFIDYKEDNIILKNTELLNILKRDINDLTFEFSITNEQNDIPNACLYGENGISEVTFSGKDNVQGKYIRSLPEEFENYFTIIFIDSGIRLPAGVGINDKKSYSNFLKIIDSIEKSLKSFKTNRIEAAEITSEEIENIESAKEIVSEITPSVYFEQNLIKDVTLLSLIFAGITAVLLIGIIFISITALKYKTQIKADDKKLKKLQSYQESLESELENTRKIKDEIELNYENKKKKTEKIEKDWEMVKKDKEYFYDGYNRLVAEKWELEKRLNKIEEELKNEKNKSPLEIEYIKTKEKGMPATISELFRTFNGLIHDNTTLKDNIRKNKLVKLMSDENIKNKVTYILIAGELKLKQALKRLLEIVSQENDERICVVAIWALGEIGEKDTANVLLKIIDKENKNIYRYCKYALRKIGHNLENESLLSGEIADNLEEKDDIYKYSGFGSKDRFLKYVLENNDEDIRVLGIKILEKYKAEDNLSLIFKTLKDKSFEIRYEAVRVLGNVEFMKDSKLLIDIDLKKKIVDALKGIMKDEKSIYIRRIAAKSLEKLLL